MPVVLKRQYSIKGNYTQKEKEILEDLISLFRLSIADDNPDQNILNQKKEQYSDNKIIMFFKRAISDINSGSPKTNFTIFQFAQSEDKSLLIDGAVVFSLISEGILQARNQIDFSDSGLSIGMFNKTQIYQGWAGFLLQSYVQNKAEFKAGLVARQGMFYGIHSEFSYNSAGFYYEDF